MCNGTNHFEAVCNNLSKKSSHLKHQKKTVHHIETSDLSDSDEEYSDYFVWTLNIEEYEQSAHCFQHCTCYNDCLWTGSIISTGK